MKKEIKDVIQFAEDHGFTVLGLTGGSHWRIRHASGAHLTLPSSPSRGRWKQNAMADIRRIHRTTQKDSQ